MHRKAYIIYSKKGKGWQKVKPIYLTVTMEMNEKLKKIAKERGDLSITATLRLLIQEEYDRLVKAGKIKEGE